MNDSTPREEDQDEKWVPPSDSDLIGLPLFLGLLVAVLAIAAAFAFIGGLAGLITLVVVLILALAVSYRVVMASDIED